MSTKSVLINRVNLLQDNKCIHIVYMFSLVSDQIYGVSISGVRDWYVFAKDLDKFVRSIGNEVEMKCALLLHLP